jgi:hypothetical protein
MVDALVYGTGLLQVIWYMLVQVDSYRFINIYLTVIV